MVKIGIFGACGKMGMKIAALSLNDKNIKIAAAIEKADHPMLGTDINRLLGCRHTGIRVSSDADRELKKTDCAIDFTLPCPTIEHLKYCLKSRIPMVIGTTGFSAAQERYIKESSKKIAIVFSPNMSIGVNVLFSLIKEASRVLAGDFLIKVDETHHVHKKDSPSGTAKMITRIIKETSGKNIPVKAFRKGEVVGNHGITYESDFETLEIRHDAKSRDVFAAGALKAAEFVANRKKGLYTMYDVLGL